jgi:hypothetical protein
MFIDQLQVTFSIMSLESSTKLPAEPPYRLIHNRTYSVNSYYVDENTMMVRGTVHDQKPPGLYLTEDPEPLSIHLMTVDLTIAYPALEITNVETTMDVTPHLKCTDITDSYSALVGLSIARGFGRKVKERFGGPQGCTHIGALLQAMAPVVVQSMWSMRRASGDSLPMSADDNMTREQRKASMAFNLNSCHVWDESSEMAQSAIAGEPVDKPLWIINRLAELGREPDDWDGW